jgi:hypothetical protein
LVCAYSVSSVSTVMSNPRSHVDDVVVIICGRIEDRGLIGDAGVAPADKAGGGRFDIAIGH